jgi:stage II sporulation protein D
MTRAATSESITSVVTRALTLLVVGVALLTTGAAAAHVSDQPTVTTTTFVLRGRGWGHGVGMGQWGAYGQAMRGVTYDRILAHYYPGTSLEQAPASSIRVLLRQGKGPFAISSQAPFSVRDGSGVLHDLDAGTLKVGVDLQLTLQPGQPATALPGPLTFLPGAEALAVGRRQYRGNIVLQVVEKRLQVVNALGLDAYVRGVVSEEVPDDWPPEAIKAQAVAARSYALSQRLDGAILYADTRSQVYGGIAAESKLGDGAVAATRHQVLMYDGRVASTYFYSSSGGRTANVKDVFVGAKTIPYLVSVPDPDDKVSPYHRWGPVVLSAGKVSKLLTLPGTTELRSVPASGRARSVVVTAKAGETTVPAGTVRFALGLRSTWFTVGTLTLSRPAGSVPAGGAVTLSGSARNVKVPVELEQRVGGGPWEPGPAIALDQSRAFTLRVTPEETTDYRLTAADGVVSSSLRVQVAALRTLAVARSAARVAAHEPRAPSFVPDDPLAASQWHLAAIHAFDFWPTLPLLDPVTVAVIDTGIDLGHPDLARSILATKSFVGGSASDTIGHGTFVAGLIAASVDNAVGVAGIAFPARLLIAKVAAPDGGIDASVEARAIRWAADRGARVINLSVGGLRDPVHTFRDTYSQEEADAVAYARRKGALVVAAVGNGDQAPGEPWPYASYPSALPHVIGVSALTQSGAVPLFSNRDAVYDDMAAPGQGLISTLPRTLTASRPSCFDQGYSICGPEEFQDGSGTSFSAAEVSAAAALLFAVRPQLTADQASAILERTAVDATPATGCRGCAVGRDSRTGWGMLDVTAALEALSGPVPKADRYETNDDAGTRAATLYGQSISAQATLDFWDDQIDVYRVKLRARQRLGVSLRGPANTSTKLILWRPGTEHVEGLSRDVQSQRVTQSYRSGPNQWLTHRVDEGGWYYVEVKMTQPGAGAYRLRISKTG